MADGDGSAAKVPRVTLPGTSIEVSVLALGTWQFGDPTATYTKPGAEAEAEIVRAAFASGINFFDTAEAYGGGEAELSLGAAIRAAGIPREEIVVATKISPSHLSPDDIPKALDQSLENLGMEYVDLYQVHWPSRDIPIADSAAALTALVKSGKVKALGVSNFGPKDLEDLRAAGVPFCTNQVPYSLLWRAIEHEVIPSTVPAGILAYSPLQQGLLTGKYAKTEDCGEGLARSRLFDPSVSPKARHTNPGCEPQLWEFVALLRTTAEELGKPMAHVALSWVLQQPHVTAALFGVSKPEQIARNAAAAADPIPKETVDKLTEASAAIKEHVGPNCDLWDDKDGGRYR